MASAGITSSVSPFTIENGKYGSSTGITATINSTGSPSGPLSQGDVTIAQTQLGALQLAINNSAFITEYIGTTINTPITFRPNTKYTSSAASLTFASVPIVFDAENKANAQFFVIASSSITLNNIPSITFINGATNCNIFWLANTGAITITGTSPTTGIPGVLIAHTQVTFANPTKILGRVYAKTANITFDGVGVSSDVNGNCITNGGGGGGGGAISNICFLENTPILTDQGSIVIKNINPEKHTIKNQKIVAITKTVTQDDHLVCFEKHALGRNCPSQKTVMSKNHKIYFRGKLVEALHFIKYFDNVHTVKYNGEILYNVLMENYMKINVNNMICESLHPKNIIAKLYTGDFNENKDEIIKQMNDCILSNDYKNYLHVVSKIRQVPKK